MQLCYTRGSVIPCWLTLESGDVQALELFAAPDALQIHLRRCVRYAATSISASQVGVTSSFATLAHAVWWTHPEQDGAYTRTLEGEIRLPAGLAADAAVGQYSISVRISGFFFWGSLI